MSSVFTITLDKSYDDINVRVNDLVKLYKVEVFTSLEDAMDTCKSLVDSQIHRALNERMELPYCLYSSAKSNEYILSFVINTFKDDQETIEKTERLDFTITRLFIVER